MKYVIYLALAILGLSVLSPFLFADGHLNRRCVVSAPVIHAPVKRVVVHHDDYQHYERIVLVPKAIQVEVQRNHYYSIDGAAQQSLLADAIVGRLLRLQAEGKGVTPGGTGRLPTGPAKRPSPTGEDGGPGAQEPKAGEYQNEALLKVVNDSCAKCHGPSSKFTKLVTIDGKLNDLPAGKVWECFALVNSGEMPKGGKALNDDFTKLFYDWGKNAKR